MWPVIRRVDTKRTAPHRQYVEPERRGVWESGLYPGEPETCRRDLRHFLPVLGHLAIMLGVFRVYRVEGRGFLSLAVFALLALPVHYALPYRWKKPLFVAVSFAGLSWVFGLETGAWVLAFSSILVGTCYLPIPWPAKAGMIGGFAGLAAWGRAGGGALAAIPDGVWPVLATMFMFRMMIYLYELKHAKKPETLVDTLSYFFLLPNFCFPHFPVVDYRTFQRGYFAKDVHETQRAGMRMIFKGTTHLLLYRLVYHEILIKPDDVNGPLALLTYLVSNYLLYLRVSGQFHVACGMLHLFGYQLPETHRQYLLASSFTDYWRRINIYWKDFMVRVVFNPVVFSMKRKPMSVTLGAATAVVFVTTWALHAYQSFWLRGSWGFSAPDALFWGILGLLVMVNVQLDARRKPVKKGETAGRPLAMLAARGAKTLGTFATIALLWSLWSSPSVGAWASMLGRGVGIGG